MTARRAPGPEEHRRGADAADRLRRLAVSDTTVSAHALEAQLESAPAPTLDCKTDALVRLAALIAVGAPGVSYRWIIEATFAAGATADEVVGTLIAVAPTVGLVRLVSATPPVALAVGYDIDAALERLDMPLDRSSPDRTSEGGS